MIEFDVMDTQGQAPMDIKPFHEWLLPNGKVWTRFYRVNTDYLLRFPELADFEISSDGRTIKCLPVPGVSRETIEHLYLNQALPLAMSKQGKLIFHASAVEVNAAAVAFMAVTGRGKSTMAASFANKGCLMLADDGLYVDECTDGYIVRPGHPSIRLWEDSRQAIGCFASPRYPSVQYTTKVRLIAGDDFFFCEAPRPLHRVYFLGDGNVKKTTFQRVRPSESLIELLKHSFLLDIESWGMVAGHFDQLSRLASQSIFYRLDYPRRFELLDDLRQDILQHLHKMP